MIEATKEELGIASEIRKTLLHLNDLLVKAHDLELEIEVSVFKHSQDGLMYPGVKVKIEKVHSLLLL